MKKPLPRPQPPTHLVPAYFARPSHQITVDLVGCGGTGSVMLTQLARIHLALEALNHPGLMVRVFDGDTVSMANLGRQLFAFSDVGQNKAVVAVTRINRFHGLNWLAVPMEYRVQDKVGDYLTSSPREHFGKRAPSGANIVITAVDTAAARLEIANYLSFVVNDKSSIYNKAVDANRHNRGSYYGGGGYDGSLRTTTADLPLYWLDIGNGKTAGQVVLGNFEPMPQPKPKNNSKETDEHCLKVLDHQRGREWVGRLPTALDVFGDLREYETGEIQGPSCSLAEALENQDLFINPAVANLASALLWKLLRNEELQVHGGFINLETLTMTPLAVKRAHTERMPHYARDYAHCRVPLVKEAAEYESEISDEEKKEIATQLEQAGSVIVVL